MNYTKLTIPTLLATAALCVTGSVLSQQPSQQPSQQAPARNLTSAPVTGNGNAQAGQQIATAGVPNNGVAACVGCHGAKGEGNAAAGFPRIAGMPRLYLAQQLVYYADGTRQNPVMQPIAKGLSPQQRDDVAAYYAALDTPWTKPEQQPAADALKRGQQLAEAGDNNISVQSCANCHGPGGSGEPPNIPYLAGQHQPYLVAALGEWKNGTRKTDPSLHMNTIAKRLSDKDITAISAYFATQAAPLPEPQRQNIPMASQSRPVAPGSTQTGGTTPATGTGSEQGAATTGGGQGPGGGGGGSGSGPQGSPTGEGR